MCAQGFQTPSSCQPTPRSPTNFAVAHPTATRLPIGSSLDSPSESLGNPGFLMHDHEFACKTQISFPPWQSCAPQAILPLVLLWRADSVTRSGEAELAEGSKGIENLALRQQLAAYARCQKRVHVQPQERVFWVALSKVWASWSSALIMVKPATVIAWHRRAFCAY